MGRRRCEIAYQRVAVDEIDVHDHHVKPAQDPNDCLRSDDKRQPFVEETRKSRGTHGEIVLEEDGLPIMSEEHFP